MTAQPLGLPGLFLEHASRAGASEGSEQLLPRVRQKSALTAARINYACRPVNHAPTRFSLLVIQRVICQALRDLV